MSFRRRTAKAYRAPKRNSERIIRCDNGTINYGNQNSFLTYTATKACVIKSIRLDFGLRTVSVPGEKQLHMHLS